MRVVITFDNTRGSAPQGQREEERTIANKHTDDGDEPIDLYDQDEDPEILAGEEANAEEIQIPSSTNWNPADIVTDYRNTGTFEEVYVSLHDRLYRHAQYTVRKLGLPHDSVIDVLQTAMGKANVNWHKYTQGTYALGWLKMIITNTALNERRRLKNEPLTYGDMEIVMTGPSYRARSAESIVIEEVTTDEIRAAFDKVSDPYREVLKLVILEEMPYADAAVELGIPTNTALTRVHRGRAQLREILKDTMKDRGM
jgi:RNA polymerase sigma-70 factor (ECF subfamily)